MRTPRVPIRHLAALATVILLPLAVIPQVATGQRDDATLAAAITHTATRLVVTPWPGYFAYPHEREEQYGAGFGVQFPVDAANLGSELSANPAMAAGNSLLASGELVIGVEQGNGDPPVLLTAEGLGGSFACPEETPGEWTESCLAFGDGRVTFDTLGHGRMSAGLPTVPGDRPRVSSRARSLSATGGRDSVIARLVGMGAACRVQGGRVQRATCNAQRMSFHVSRFTNNPLPC